MATASPSQPGLDAFHRERSRCLDAFAATEEAVVHLLELAETKFGGEPFGKKIEHLKSAKPSPAYSKERKARVNALLADMADLLEVRNDLVHARLQPAVIGEIQKACFVNARQCATGVQTARLFSLESLRTITRQATRLAEELRKL